MSELPSRGMPDEGQRLGRLGGGGYNTACDGNLGEMMGHHIF